MSTNAMSTYLEKGITVNLFKEKDGGPWLFVWSPIADAIKDGALKPGEGVPRELALLCSLGIHLERLLRDRFIATALHDYGAAVDMVRAEARAVVADFCDDHALEGVSLSFHDRGIEH